MVPWRSNESGEVTEDVLDWYGRFAEGQPGVLVVEATGIRDIPSGPLLRIGTDETIPGLAKLVQRVRERSGGQTRLLIQLIDFVNIRRRPTPENFFQRFLHITPSHRQGLAALEQDPTLLIAEAVPEADLRKKLLALYAANSVVAQALLTPIEVEDLEYGHRERITDTHLPHIEELPRVLPGLFADATRRAEAAGFDGAELHFAHAYTMASFLSATNSRTDGFGATLEGRLKLPTEVFHACRAAASPSFAVGCRMLADEVIPGGTHIEESTLIATALAEAGMDFISLSKGGKFDDARQPRVGSAAYPYTGTSGHECMPTIFIEDPATPGATGPFARTMPLAKTIRTAVRQAGFSTPIIAAGGINDFELAEAALTSGSCDFVGSARQAIADPDWFLKVEQGEGHHVRRCKLTNYCEALDERHKQVTCQLWDRDFNVPDAGEDATIKKTLDGRRRLIAPPSSTVTRD
jgi:2,4-dienoyl-CoA reductase-like NADH-dependent reductase (Old Yellow Enzyme family)